jgi:5-methylcytosine-specific restriction endonuclease McrA
MMNGSKFKRKKLYNKQNGKCFYCGKKCTLSDKKLNQKDFFTLDHVIPKARNGIDLMENLVGACFECNNKKGCKDVNEFYNVL